MDANGNSNAQIIHQWTDKLRTRLLAQVQSYKMAGYQLAMDYRTKYTSTSITLANIDLITNSGKLKYKKTSFEISRFYWNFFFRNFCFTTFGTCNE